MSESSIDLHIRKLIDLSGDLFCALTTEGYYLAMSKAWERVLGHRIVDLRAHPFDHFIFPADLPTARAAFDAIKDGTDVANVKVRFLSATKELVWIQWRGTRDEESGLIYAAGTVIPKLDVQQEQLEAERQRSVHHSKLASLGEMAAGVAHELNNPLSIVAGYLKILQVEWTQKTLTDESFNKFITATEKSLDRAARIIRTLKNLARDGAHDPMENLYVSDLVDSALDLFREKLRSHNIALRLTPVPTHRIRGRVVELSQVLLNVLHNAFDAVEGTPDAWIAIDFGDSDNDLKIRISNSGPRIPVEVHEKLFTPFFTTKKFGHGTGLGLSISIGIMQKHQGGLYLDEDANHTTFVVQLPLSTKATP